MTPQLGARYKLSAEQLRRYHRDGYVVVPDVFPVDELEAIDQEIERLLRQPGSQTDRVRRAFIVSYQEATVSSGNGQRWRILRPAAPAA
jgi:hypothetical protein